MAPCAKCSYINMFWTDQAQLNCHLHNPLPLRNPAFRAPWEVVFNEGFLIQHNCHIPLLKKLTRLEEISQNLHLTENLKVFVQIKQEALPLLPPHRTAPAVDSFSPALPPSEATLLKVEPPFQDQQSTWEKRDGGKAVRPRRRFP